MKEKERESAERTRQGNVDLEEDGGRMLASVPESRYLHVTADFHLTHVYLWLSRQGRTHLDVGKQETQPNRNLIWHLPTLNVARA
jgi:hypothetical protein